MENFDEIVKELNELKIKCVSCDWEDNLPEELFNKYFEGKYKTLERGLEPDERRWYEATVTVIKFHERNLGIKHVTKLYSESSDVSDCFVDMVFFEMEEFTTISYKAKK